MNVPTSGAEIHRMSPHITEQVELFPQQGTWRQQLAESFRTRLNAIIGFSELLALESLSANGQNDLKQVLKAARDLLSVVNQELGARLSDSGSPGALNNAPVPHTCDLLYIEDDVASVILLERILELRPGVSLKHAAFGRRGIEMAKTENPKLVLLDLNLPDMNGADVIEVLQSSPQTSAIPVVVLSANAIGSQIERLLAAGARNYLTKPFDIEQFLAVVDEWTQGRGD
jgi:CheY-like chemotaxis protein